MEEILSQLKTLLWKGGLAAMAAGLLMILGRYLLQWHYPKRDRPNPRQTDRAPAREPEEQDDTIPLATRSSVRKWRVCGVDKASGNDATWYIEAESRANAKVKAELKGMIVTAVERAAGER
jgi:hypothetical protein